MIHRKSFYLMRHGATEWNLKGVLQGQTDIPLHETGIQEAQNSIITHAEITHVFYSPLQRARQTMQIVTQHMDCPKEELPGIQEWHLGTLEGTPRGSFDQTHKTLCPPGGESWTQFRERVVQAINVGLAKEVFAIEHPRLNNCDLVKFTAAPGSDRWHMEKQPRK